MRKGKLKQRLTGNRLEQRNADAAAGEEEAAAEEREVEEAGDSVEGAGEPETRDTSAGTR